MKTTVWALAALFVFCPLGPVSAADILVTNPVPFSDSAIVADNIKSECAIDVQLAEAIKAHAVGRGVAIAFVQSLDTAQGTALKLEIVDAQSTGNAFTGHLKTVTVRGALFQEGVQTAAFTGRRLSRGGAMAGFKGSCAVLERTVKAIGSDIAGWLGKPVDGAKLGDL
ncbi:hypothetical protein [Pseudoxanthomonas wuyuanensis]